MNQPLTTEDLSSLRKALAAERAEVGREHRLRHAEKLAEAAVRQPWFRQASRIAIYIAIRGEADPVFIGAQARRLGKTVYLPVLDGSHLLFRPWCPRRDMVPNRYGILEPADGAALRGEELDLVFTPLLAFDGQGHRLGMGGGYYDRSFAHRLEQPERVPRLVGVAYEFQCQPALPAQPWDVPLDAAVTENGWQEFDRS